jgi:septal ring factor EnvC (AmiA/AmiB activator)
MGEKMADEQPLLSIVADEAHGFAVSNVIETMKEYVDQLETQKEENREKAKELMLRADELHGVIARLRNLIYEHERNEKS